MIKILLNAVTETGASESLTWPTKGLAKHLYYFFRPNPYHTVQIMTTGNPTAVIIDLEGSLVDQEEAFAPLGSHTFSPAQITAQRGMFHCKYKTVQYIRLNLKTLTGGTNPTVTAWYHGFEIKRRD